MVYNFLCKDEKKHAEISTYFCLIIGVERSSPFFRTVYPNRNHVTTHPVNANHVTGVQTTSGVARILRGNRRSGYPWKITSYIRFYGNRQFDPRWKKLDPPGI